MYDNICFSDLRFEPRFWPAPICLLGLFSIVAYFGKWGDLFILFVFDLNCTTTVAILNFNIMTSALNKKAILRKMSKISIATMPVAKGSHLCHPIPKTNLAELLAIAQVLHIVSASPFKEGGRPLLACFRRASASVVTLIIEPSNPPRNDRADVIQVSLDSVKIGIVRERGEHECYVVLTSWDMLIFVQDDIKKTNITCMCNVEIVVLISFSCM